MKTQKMLEVEERIGESLGDYLRRRYVINGESSVDIAEDIGVTSTSVLSWLRGYGINIRALSEARLHPGVTKASKEELERRYVTNGESAIQIAEDIGVTPTTVCNWLESYSIERRSTSEAKLPLGVTKLTKEELEELYVNKWQSSVEIAEDVGVSQPTILHWLGEYDIEVRTNSESKLPPGVTKLTKEELERRYITKRESTIQIAKDLEVAVTTIRNWLEDYGIEVRSHSEARLPPGVTRPSKKKLEKLYMTERKSANRIAEELGIGSTTVRGWLEDYGIERRDVSEARLPLGVTRPSKEELEERYVTNRESSGEIAASLGIARATVSRWLRQYDIQTRSISETQLPVGFTKPSKEELEERYVTNRESANQIGEDIGVSYPTVLRWLREYDIEIKDNPCDDLKPSKEELESRYVVNRESANQMAEDIGVSWPTVVNWLRGYGIPIRNSVKDRLEVLEEILEEFTSDQDTGVDGL